MTDPAPRQDAALKNLLEPSAGGGRIRRWLWSMLAVLLLAGVGLWFFGRGDTAAAPRYATEAVRVGELVVKVSATGNLQPTNQVEVGSELSGIVDRVLVDENDHVKKGQVLARLDLAKLNDAVAKSRASLAATQAQVLQAEATTAEARAALSRFREVARLSGGKVPSQSEMDAAIANLKRAEANEASARASVVQARANLQSDETNLAKASIRSPIDGIVLSRKVEPGQTVAASFQAPVLFTLAEDLAKMELQVDVDEADVGQVQVGQKARFTVDAWPGREYDATISRVGYGAQQKDGVVSYLAVLDVDNADLSLRPGMTGTAEITTLTRADALLVPNAALRFSPVVAAAPQKKASGNLMSMMMPRPPSTRLQTQGKGNGESPRVWLLRDGQPVAVEVKTGASNGRYTEIVGGALTAGTPVITESLSAQP